MHLNEYGEYLWISWKCMDFLTNKITLIWYPLHFDNIHSAIIPLSFTVQQKFTNIPIGTFTFHLYEHEHIEVNVGDLRIAKLFRKICIEKYLKNFDRPKKEKKSYLLHRIACGVGVKESGEKNAHGKKACIRNSLYGDEHMLTGESSNHSNFCSVNFDYKLKIKTTMRISRRFDVKKTDSHESFFLSWLQFESFNNKRQIFPLYFHKSLPL